ncbi:hypothetical protein CC86DRAFT_373697 [Ophiobolus disseminans]|uniref:Uncharacterized protein n=1 Tax=Ophiobolus disseminans TaxID=1469910 RepID=A0A6A6ZK68_9PLEO|nr:hypothetical protein CC86DRAFT_373697 [Ophiobolus disseminans]
MSIRQSYNQRSVQSLIELRSNTLQILALGLISLIRRRCVLRHKLGCGGCAAGTADARGRSVEVRFLMRRACEIDGGGGATAMHRTTLVRGFSVAASHGSPPLYMELDKRDTRASPAEGIAARDGLLQWQKSGDFDWPQVSPHTVRRRAQVRAG